MDTLKFVLLQVFNVINKVIMAFKIVERSIDLDARNVIDKDIKNKWVRNWLLEKNINDYYLSDYIRKIDHPRVVICTWCKELLHGSSGEKCLKLHATQNKEKHQKTKEIFLKNTMIPNSWIDLSKVAEPSDVCDKPFDLPYGIAANIHDSETCTTKRQVISRPIVSVKDHTLNTEAFFLSFTVENSLPLSKVPKLVEFAKFLSRDVSALNGEIDRTAATQIERRIAIP